jgi:hypothetical protein
LEAFGIALITDFGYWLIIRVQENQPPDLFTVPFVAGYIALMGALLGISVTTRERVVVAVACSTLVSNCRRE